MNLSQSRISSVAPQAFRGSLPASTTSNNDKSTTSVDKNKRTKIVVGVEAAAVAATAIALIAINKGKGAKNIVSNQSDDLNIDFSHLIQEIPKTKEGIDKRINEIVDVFCKKLDIKVKPEVKIVDNYWDLPNTIKDEKTNASYDAGSRILYLIRESLTSTKCYAKDPSGNFVKKIAEIGGGRYTLNVDEMREYLCMGYDLVEASDKDKLLKFCNTVVHELRHRWQQEGEFMHELIGPSAKEQISINKYNKIINDAWNEYESELLTDGTSRDEIDIQKRLFHQGEGVKGIMSEISKCEEKIAQIEKVFSPYKNSVKADSAEGKLIKSIFDQYKFDIESGHSTPYLDRLDEIDAYKFEKEFVMEKFPKMFGITKEEADLI